MLREVEETVLNAWAVKRYKDFKKVVMVYALNATEKYRRIVHWEKAVTVRTAFLWNDLLLSENPGFLSIQRS